VNLRGYDPGQPMSASVALAQCLAAVGVAGAELPLELDARHTAVRRSDALTTHHHGEADHRACWSGRSRRRCGRWRTGCSGRSALRRVICLPLR
jgi:hypothetical protein